MAPRRPYINWKEAMNISATTLTKIAAATSRNKINGRIILKGLTQGLVTFYVPL